MDDKCSKCDNPLTPCVTCGKPAGCGDSWCADCTPDEPADTEVFRKIIEWSILPLDDPRSLLDYLGMTREEYQHWISDQLLLSREDLRESIEQMRRGEGRIVRPRQPPD